MNMYSINRKTNNSRTLTFYIIKIYSKPFISKKFHRISWIANFDKKRKKDWVFKFLFFLDIRNITIHKYLNKNIKWLKINWLLSSSNN